MFFYCFPLLLSPLHAVTVMDDGDYVVYSFFSFPLLFITALSLTFLAPAVALVYY